MNSEEIIKVIDELCKKFGVAIDWTSQNVLPYLKEVFSRIVTYNIITSSLSAVLGIIFFILGVILGKKVIKEGIKSVSNKKDSIWWDYGYGPEFLSILAIIGASACLIAGLVITCCSVSDLIQWIVAPELGLYHLIQNMTY